MTDKPNENHEWELMEDLFDRGKDLPPSSREALLEEASPGLAERVRQFWAASDEKDPFLEAIGRLTRSIWAKPHAESIAGYRIEDELGAGSMGRVYKAMQEKTGRHVALKIMPICLDSSYWIYRFREEKKLLARLSHPNVATVHDAGIGEKGRPYIALELLDGLPLTEYADKNCLSIDQRLDLFVEICRGLTHAHQRGILHCDIKPSNILVIEREGRAIPKIIDFSIARTLDADETGPPPMGTPEYMSPEQAGAQGGELDTRSDIYALGSLLFELLIGEPPLARALADAHHMDDICRVVKEEPPAEPWTLIAGTCAGNMRRAEARATNPHELRRRMQSDLTPILKKALAKDPSERYTGCPDLVEDLERFRQGRPVDAIPRSTMYLTRKWLQRHFLATGLATALILFLIVNTITTTMALRETRAARDELQAFRQFSLDIFLGDPLEHYSHPELDLVARLDQAAAGVTSRVEDSPNLKANMNRFLGLIYRGMGDLEKAGIHLTQASVIYGSQDPNSLEHIQTLGDLAFTDTLNSNYSRAMTGYDACLSRVTRLLGPDHPRTLVFVGGRATVLARMGKLDQARQQLRYVHERQTKILGSRHSQTLATGNNLGNLLIDMKQLDAAEDLLEQSLSDYGETKGEWSALELSLGHNLALAYHRKKRYDRAVELGERVYYDRLRILGRDHPDTMSSANNLGAAMAKAGKGHEAVILLEELLDQLGQDMDLHRVRLRLRHSLGDILNQTGEPQRALPVLEDTLELRTRVLGGNHRKTLVTKVTLGETLIDLGRREEAESVLLESLEIAEGKHPSLVKIIEGLLQRNTLE